MKTSQLFLQKMMTLDFFEGSQLNPSESIKEISNSKKEKLRNKKRILSFSFLLFDISLILFTRDLTVTLQDLGSSFCKNLEGFH